MGGQHNGIVHKLPGQQRLFIINFILPCIIPFAFIGRFPVFLDGCNAVNDPHFFAEGFPKAFFQGIPGLLDQGVEGKNVENPVELLILFYELQSQIDGGFRLPRARWWCQFTAIKKPDYSGSFLLVFPVPPMFCCVWINVASFCNFIKIICYLTIF